MSRVACLEVPGLDLWFNSHDHLPPHFHAEKVDAWGVRVFFLRDAGEMFELVWPPNAPIPRRELKTLAVLVKENRAALLAEFETKVNVRDPGPTR
jgi:hypothetical protein